MSINNLMINCIESQYTQEYIANVFWRLNIAKVRSITLIPYIKNNIIYNMAYIYIDQWCETETAYNFIKRMKDSSKEVRVIYQDDDWWTVELNTHNNGNIFVGNYTLLFDENYYKNESKDDDSTAPCTELDEPDNVCDDEEWEEFRRQRPIKGLGNDYYSIDEAFEHLSELEHEFTKTNNMEEYVKIEREMQHFGNELSLSDTQNWHQFIGKYNTSANSLREVACSVNELVDSSYNW